MSDDFDHDLSLELDWALKRLEEGCDDPDDMQRIHDLTARKVPQEDEDA